RQILEKERAEEREETERRKAAREADRRAKAHLKELASGEAAGRRQRTVGTGVVYQQIAEAAEAEGIAINTLMVLTKKHDPYGLDTVEGHANAKWFAEQVTRFVPDGGQVHLRGLHYRIVAAADVKCPDGTPYVNDERCWKWLQQKAAKAARWLSYVQFERI